MDTTYIHREPLGVCLVMGAWNYPVQLTLHPVTGAIASGNCVVIKPSEVASSTALVMEKLITKYVLNSPTEHSSYLARVIYVSKKLSHHFLLHFSIGMGSYDHYTKYQDVSQDLL